MPSNVFSTIAAHAKAHHDSLNAAYQATYSPRASISTPHSSRQSSTTSEEAQHSDRNITKAWKAIKKHHQEMNEAYAVFYAPGVVSTPGSSRSSSAAPTPKVSFEAERERQAELEPRNYQKVWKAIKTRAVEHHNSVNAASAARYA